MVTYWSPHVLPAHPEDEARAILLMGATFAALRLQKINGPQVSRLPGAIALTPRELSVMRLLSNGCQFNECAKLLGLGTETIRSHLKKAQAKLGVRSQVDPIRPAMGMKSWSARPAAASPASLPPTRTPARDPATTARPRAGPPPAAPGAPQRLHAPARQRQRPPCLRRLGVTPGSLDPPHEHRHLLVIKPGLRHRNPLPANPGHHGRSRQFSLSSGRSRAM